MIIGECIEPCGFIEDIKARIGPGGEIRVFDITDEARDSYIAKKRVTVANSLHGNGLIRGRFQIARLIVQPVYKARSIQMTGAKPGPNYCV